MGYHVVTVTSWEHTKIQANIDEALERQSLKLPVKASTFQHELNSRAIVSSVLGHQSDIIRYTADNRYSYFQPLQAYLEGFSSSTWLHVDALEVADIPTTYLTKSEYALHRKLSLSSINRLIENGLPIIRIGRSIRIDLDKADAYLDSKYGSDKESKYDFTKYVVKKASKK